MKTQTNSKKINVKEAENRKRQESDTVDDESSIFINEEYVCLY